MPVDLAMNIVTGSLCGMIGGALATISAWFLVDEWRWRRVRMHLATVAQGVLGIAGALAFMALATLAWAAVFA